MNEELKVSKITDSLNREVLGDLEIHHNGTVVDDYAKLMEVAKTMSTAKYGIPPHLRGNPGDCLAIREIALDKGLSPYGLARHCYVVNDMLCFDGQAVHAIVEKSGRLSEALDFDYAGEGDTRTCTVSGRIKGTATARAYTTPPIGKITPKNSPLWRNDPDQQLAYLAVRRWAGRYCPAALLGIYSREEMLDSMVDVTPKPTSPNLIERLPGRVGSEGFAETTAEAAQEEAQALNKAEEARRAKAENLRKAREAKAKKVSATPAGKRSEAKGGGKAPEAQKPIHEAPQGLPDAIPTTKAGYVDYVRRVLASGDPRFAVAWYLSDDQEALRLECNVDDLTYKQLLTLASDAEKRK